jgi:hypothetical protein
LLDGGIIVTTHLRAAAGACALSIGLIVCSSSGAVAVADQTDTGGTVADTQDGSSAGTTSKKITFSGPMTRIGNQRVDENDENAEGTTTVTTITSGSATNSTNENSPTSTVEAQTNTSQDDPGTGTVETNLGQVEATQNPVESTLQVIAPIVESLTPETLTPETLSPTGSNTPPSATPQANGEPGESGNSGAPVPPTPGSVAPKPNITTVVGHFSNAFNSLAQGLGASTL